VMVTIKFFNKNISLMIALIVLMNLNLIITLLIINYVNDKPQNIINC
jgi:hypothetical protein